MEDIYDDSGTSDYIDGVVGGVVLAKFLSDNSDSTYEGLDTDSNSLHVDQTSAWKQFAPPTKGLGSLITCFVRISTIIISIAMIVMLFVCGFLNGFNL